MRGRKLSAGPTGPIATATPERLAKAGADIEDFIADTGARTKRMLDGSVLDMLASRRSISGDQYAAGCRLYADWYHAGLASSGVIDPARVVVDGGQSAGANDRILDAAGRFKKALLAVGKVHSHPLVNIVLLAQRLEDYGRNRYGVTDAKDARLKAITTSMRHAKDHLQSLPRSALTQYTMLVMAPYILSLVTGIGGRTRPVFNVTISNVPGPDKPLYFQGAMLEAMYPISLLAHGGALNITCVSYDGKLNFGFTGARDTLPKMQRLAVYTGEALEELEKVLSV